jgi:hypothetical protein
MCARVIQVLLASVLALASGPAFAQEDTAEMQDMRQQFQQIREQVLQNMAQKGIDPMQFFGDIRQQMQNGTFDMAALQQKLIDQELLDKETIAKLQTTAQNATLNLIQRQLDVNDAEWGVLQPKIQRVIAANFEAGVSNRTGPAMMALTSGKLPTSEVAKRKKELQAAIANPKTTNGEFQLKLRALRDASQKAKEELDAAQKDLIGVLTVRQEAVLVLLGVL